MACVFQNWIAEFQSDDDQKAKGKPALKPDRCPYAGATLLAKKLKVSLRTVNHWTNREGYPKVDTMRELIRLSDGVLTYQIIIDCCAPKGGGKC